LNEFFYFGLIRNFAKIIPVMTLLFFKYHGAGNDFVLVDNRSGKFSFLSEKAIALLCDRHFGIGADGLMFLEKASGEEDFAMRYFNADGREGTMCGNGGRCITAFARRLMGLKKQYVFRAIDGQHRAEIVSEQESTYTIRLKMADVQKVEKRGNNYCLNTGSPHFIHFVEDVKAIDLIPAARAIRYNKELTSGEGANINYVQKTPGALLIRTYERGVEDETLACGTGAVAAAIAMHCETGDLRGKTSCTQHIQARGGGLSVSFICQNSAFTEVYLIGPAAFVFEGTFDVQV
jgi:diaminopimelate epimerase